VDWRNSHNQDHIITIEDPIEYVHQHKKCIVTQREVGWIPKTGNCPEKHPASGTGRDPDGEIRDRETMGYALQFAETGHLCLATLHANQALDRILNFFPDVTSRC
jgi:twitching motility protein PilU